MNAAIIGASGYSGEELVRLLSRHPNVELTAVTSELAAVISELTAVISELAAVSTKLAPVTS